MDEIALVIYLKLVTSHEVQISLGLQLQTSLRQLDRQVLSVILEEALLAILTHQMQAIDRGHLLYLQPRSLPLRRLLEFILVDVQLLRLLFRLHHPRLYLDIPFIHPA